MAWSPGDPWGDARAGRARETQGAATGVQSERIRYERRGLTEPQADLLSRLADAGHYGLYLRGSDKRVYEPLRERGLAARVIEGWGSITPKGRAFVEEQGYG